MRAREHAVTDRDTQIARLTGRGYTQAEVASRLRISGKTVQRALKRPEVAAAARRVREASDPDAVAVLRELLSDPSSQVRLGAARTLLLSPIADDPADSDDGRARITVVAAAGG